MIDGWSVRNPLHLIERHLITAPVIKPGSPCRFMTGHVLSDLQLAAILEVGCDAGRAEAVGADLGSQPGRFGPFLNHQMNIGLGQGSAPGQPAIAQGREERGIGFAGEPRRGYPLL